MKDVLALTKVLIKNTFQKSLKSERNIGKLLLYVFAFGYIGAIVGYLSYQVIKILIQINQEGVFISVILLGIAFFMLLQAIFTSLNTLFFSKDLEYILPLPISNIKILIAKFNVLIISEYLLELIVGLIPLILYGYMTGVGYIYYIVMVIVLLLYPILPIMLSSALVIIIMRFTNVIKNKDFVQYITVGLTLAFVILIQLTTSSQTEISNVDIAEKVLEANGLVLLYEDYFITLSPTINALLNYDNLEGLKNIVILFAETFLIYAIIIHIASRLYMKTVTKGFSGGTSKTKKINNRKDYMKKGQLKSYLEKEFKVLVKNPIFFMQCVVPSFLFPVIMSIPLLNIFNDQTVLYSFMEAERHIESTLGLSICLSIITFFFMFNFVSITAISRDGTNATFMKYIPISLYKQCIYKILPSIILNIVPQIYVVVILRLIFPTISSVILIYLIIIGILLNIFQSCLMIILDLKRPKLVWYSEYSVVKQNFNMMFEMLFGVLVICISLVLAIILPNMSIYVFVLITALLVCVYYVNMYMYKNQNKLFKKVM